MKDLENIGTEADPIYRTIASKHITKYQEEENYMFNMMKIKDKMIEFYTNH